MWVPNLNPFFYVVSRVKVQKSLETHEKGFSRGNDVKFEIVRKKRKITPNSVIIWRKKNSQSTLTNVNGVNVILNSDLDHLFCEKCFREHFLICAKIQKLTLFTKKQSSSEPVLVEQTYYVRFTQKNVSSFHF